MKKSKNTQNIDAYIKKLYPWQKKIVVKLRMLVHKADPDIIEDWKWNKPAFSHDGLVCCIWAFKKWVSFTLYQGSLVPDTHKLYNHGSFMDRNRTIAFTDALEIKEKYLIEYIKKAVKNNTQGYKVRITTKRTDPISLSAFIQKHLNATEKTIFTKRPPYQKRDYIAWVESAKQEKTRTKRLLQMKKELQAGNVYMGMRWRGNIKK